MTQILTERIVTRAIKRKMSSWALKKKHANLQRKCIGTSLHGAYTIGTLVLGTVHVDFAATDAGQSK